jgi:hypothetical protein
MSVPFREGEEKALKVSLLVAISKRHKSLIAWQAKEVGSV